MTKMTEEEAFALDDFVTNNEITLAPNGSGWLAQREMLLLGFSNLAVNYLIAKATAEHKTTAQVFDELVCEKLAEASA